MSDELKLYYLGLVVVLIGCIFAGELAGGILTFGFGVVFHAVCLGAKKLLDSPVE